MSRDFTLRTIQSQGDINRRKRKQGKVVSKQAKSIKKLKPVNNYNKGKVG